MFNAWDQEIDFIAAGGPLGVVVGRGAGQRGPSGARWRS